MKLYRKEKVLDVRNIFICDIKLLSYTTNKLQNLYDSRRFDKKLPIKLIKKFITWQFKHISKYKPNIENPKTFNEKIQWIKLYDHNPIYTKLADKYAVREYIKAKLGDKYLIPLLGVWDDPDKIDFNMLPDKFVLKVNWGSGQNIIVTDKENLDIIATRTRLRNWIQPHSNHYFFSFEWQYKNIPPKIIAEQYIGSLDESCALDYKFMCFGGTPYLCWVSNKNKEVHERSFYDMSWNMTDIELIEPGKVLPKQPVPKPKQLEEMIYIAKKLSNGFPEVRVDLYLLPNGDIKFGELTFTSASGYSPWKTKETDLWLGSLIDLSKIKKWGAK